ncbi:MAG: hypothetical protein IPJ62_09505 [Betaproteobacteria bacterium]|nr:hypothetical protein [Betaproteobacteria bacterium]
MTTAPVIEIDITTGIDRCVVLTTGKLPHENDLADTAVQTLYAFRRYDRQAGGDRDGGKSRSDLISVTDADGLKARPDKGWHDDLPTFADRWSADHRRTPGCCLICRHPATYPSTRSCATGLPATLYAREFARGNSLLDTGGAIMESIDLPDGGVGLDLISLEKDATSGSTDPNLRGYASRVPTRARKEPSQAQEPGAAGRTRMSWRLIGD